MDQLLDLETLKKLSPEQQNQVIAGVKQQAALANAQSLITVCPDPSRISSCLTAQDLSEKCTAKCLTNPGNALSGTEKQCLQRCMDRFMDSWNLVSQVLQKRLQDEAGTSTSFS